VSENVVLRATDLEVSYGRIRAVQGVSLDVHDASITALVGANGAGKSSILAGIAGLVRLSGGRVEAPAGRDIKHLPPHRRVRELGLVLVPEGRGVFATMTVDENLALGARVGGDRRSASVGEGEAIERVLELFPNLRSRRRLQARYLSGGERQMLAIARALLMEPAILLIDEPSMGLSPIVVADIFRTLQDVLAEKQISVLLVEQDTKLAFKVADYAYVIEHGRVENAGPAEDLRLTPDLQAAYLGAIAE
jgi:branched-chain amino acid transport system ATP-binding protein